MKNLKNKIILIAVISSWSACGISEGIRYDSNSDRYKRQHGIHREPARTQSGPRSNVFYR